MTPNNQQFGFGDQGINTQNGQFMNQQQFQGFQNQPQAVPNGMYVPSYDSRNFMNRQPIQPPQPGMTQQFVPQFTGKFIGDISEIMPNDIPMDGRPALFPSRDGSSILVKTWKSNGQILTIRYVVDPTQFQEQPTAQNELEDIRSRLETLEQSLRQQTTKPKTTRKDDTTNA